MWGFRRLQQMRISDLNTTAFGNEHRVQGLVPSRSAEAVQTAVPGQPAMGGTVAQRRGGTVAEEIKELQHCASLVITLYGLSSCTIAQVISTADHYTFCVGRVFHQCIIICMAYDTHTSAGTIYCKHCIQAQVAQYFSFIGVFRHKESSPFVLASFHHPWSFRCIPVCICTNGACEQHQALTDGNTPFY